MDSLLNPVECWDQLTAEQQRTFGAAGIAHLLGTFGALTDRPQNIYVTAEFEGYELMVRSLEEIFPELRINPPKPDLRALGIRTCRKCGCTDNCGCDEGCNWVEEDLCSTCVGIESKEISYTS
jgi:hypothetical protein